MWQLKFDHRMYGVDWSGIMMSTRIATRSTLVMVHVMTKFQFEKKVKKTKTKQNKIDLKKLTNVFSKTWNWWQNIWF